MGYGGYKIIGKVVKPGTKKNSEFSEKDLNKARKAGSLALAAGEALVHGQPLTEKKRKGPPVPHVIHALREAAFMLDQDGRVAGAPWKSLERTPFPMMPFFLWRRMFISFAAMGWKKQASKHGIKSLQMNARPYAQ